VFAASEVILYRLARYRWQAATMVLAVAVIVLGLAFRALYLNPVKCPIVSPPKPVDAAEPSCSPHRNGTTEPAPPSHQNSEPVPHGSTTKPPGHSSSE
jgi:hypothetical protein